MYSGWIYTTLVTVMIICFTVPVFGATPICSPLYQIYVSNDHDRLITTSESEREVVLKKGASDEGLIGFSSTSNQPGFVEFFRFRFWGHFYSTDPNGEVNGIEREGSMGFMSMKPSKGMIPFYRAALGVQHLFTTNKGEYDSYTNQAGAKGEGIFGFIYSPDSSHCKMPVP